MARNSSTLLQGQVASNDDWYGDTQEHNVGRYVECRREYHVVVVCRTLSCSFVLVGIVDVDGRLLTVLNRQHPVPVNGLAPVEEQHEHHKHVRHDTKDADDLDDGMLALICEAALGYQHFAVNWRLSSQNGMNTRQSMVQNQETDLDQPEGGQSAHLHEQSHLASIDGHGSLLGREGGRGVWVHVVAAILGHFVEGEHVKSEGHSHNHHQPVFDLQL